MNWYLAVLKNYAGFSGRARRMEYWMFALVNLIIAIVLALVDRMTGTANPITGMGVLGGLYALAVLIPSIAVAVRRLHDTDRSGWWLLIGLVPVIGWIVLLVFYFTDGTPGDNKYGPSPKAAAATVAA
jgi:uncharacterized membrane protein YhaH (DUF805 family)